MLNGDVDLVETWFLCLFLFFDRVTTNFYEYFIYNTCLALLSVMLLVFNISDNNIKKNNFK